MANVRSAAKKSETPRSTTVTSGRASPLEIGPDTTTIASASAATPRSTRTAQRRTNA